MELQIPAKEGIPMTHSTNVIVQPPSRDTELFDSRRFHAGSERSKDRLRQLRYDPIGELVAEHHNLTQLIQREYDLRDKKIIVISENTGKPLTWRPDAMLKLIEQRIKIAEQLLRYGYGRVPEVVINEERSIPSFIVQTTKKGEVYHTGGELPEV